MYFACVSHKESSFSMPRHTYAPYEGNWFYTCGGEETPWQAKYNIILPVLLKTLWSCDNQNTASVSHAKTKMKEWQQQITTQSQLSLPSRLTGHPVQSLRLHNNHYLYCKILRIFTCILALWSPQRSWWDWYLLTCIMNITTIQHLKLITVTHSLESCSLCMLTLSNQERAQTHSKRVFSCNNICRKEAEKLTHCHW